MQKSKVKKLKKILRRSETESPDKIKAEAKNFLKSVDTEDLIMAEQAIIEEGIDPSSLSHLCAAHLELMSDDLEKMKSQIPENHPLSVLVAEHEEILKFLESLEKLSSEVGTVNRENDLPADFWGRFQHLTHHLIAAEKHHQREEEVLFPEVEKYGVYGPPEIMTMEHGTLRKLKKDLHDLASDRKIKNFEQFRERFLKMSGELIASLRDHIFKENNILYPAALRAIPKGKWKKIGADADKIGYCCFTPKHVGR
ncbi:DUF438 domain-containing protein [Candidatus Berkelbacteria bacterium CG10_big_fil_rev_8_21_14_0_10_43_13]|uniref:DUF438 domain-containing protein n=1 Tax=Candidatus Berkelbacteria bacterium CG10_big_fil_rev_8_21_14_0_10_43_13 TaxID=1974514 RepID=A0A2H0W7H1_9BACT|nr:MAG: DUF438 domain-containing protein [Candidatus Berkelbacteria bacterium CG10_big_fil_rev_8_21_14_0_10_43_13]